jgi:cytidine deaminase
VSLDDLLDIARMAAENASAPYSQFPVGAAVQADDGQIYRGCNIESPSYPLTVCAERVAIFSAIAAGARPLRLAVSCLRGDPTDPSSLMPCGACRQVMMDQMGPDAPVLIDGVGEFSVAQLLPEGFHLPG